MKIGILLLVISVPFYAIAVVYGETPTVAILNDTPTQVITPEYLNASDPNMTKPCNLEDNHSNFTERIWVKYCIDPQTDADYAGTNLPLG
jgi:hypothetical protein